MIHDKIINAHKYDNHHKYFKTIFNILQSINLSELQDTHIELDGKYAYILIKTVDGLTKNEAKLQAHKQYIDIHIPLSGSETIGIKQTTDCKHVLKEYTAENDIEIYNDTPCNYETLHPGEFIILFPTDAHAACITSSKTHKKLIVKISITLNTERPSL